MKIVPERQVKDLPDAKPNALVRNAGYRRGGHAMDAFVLDDGVVYHT